ncbi:MAG: hypothetical protein [Olavius algarvensis Delta 4 endosymbiont]|nr:MAG: hypothetical protein [Olavius algarvensis Delta 4 endosymbiont]
MSFLKKFKELITKVKTERRVCGWGDKPSKISNKRTQFEKISKIEKGENTIN